MPESGFKAVSRGVDLGMAAGVNPLVLRLEDD